VTCASSMGYLVAHLAKPFERFLDGFCGVPTAVFAQGLQNRGHPTEVVPFQLHTDALQRSARVLGLNMDKKIATASAFFCRAGSLLEKGRLRLSPLHPFFPQR
jgi:hypothetical protein